MQFYLGAGNVSWLWDGSVHVPLFVSYNRLGNRKALKPATVPSWALDSGGFTQLSTHGRWTIDPGQYAKDVQRYRHEIGGLEFAAIQDWMCEPWIVQKTGLTVEEHQRRTILSYIYLRRNAPDVPWIPILQGWQPEEYLRHISMYEAAGISLTGARVVGIGSVCRRESMIEADEIIQAVLRAAPGIRLHGFGVKQEGLRQFGHLLASADSMAWSFQAKQRNLQLPECAIENKHQVCNDCRRWALRWREQVLRNVGDLSVGTEQLGFFSTGLWVDNRQAAIALAVDVIGYALDDMGEEAGAHFNDILYILQSHEEFDGLSSEQLSEIALAVLHDFDQGSQNRDLEINLEQMALDVYQELIKEVSEGDPELLAHLQEIQVDAIANMLQGVSRHHLANLVHVRCA